VGMFEWPFGYSTELFCWAETACQSEQSEATSF
jgi:hypothetical protein